MSLLYELALPIALFIAAMWLLAKWYHRKEKRFFVALHSSRKSFAETEFVRELQEAGVSAAGAQFSWDISTIHYLDPASPNPSDRLGKDLKIDLEDIEDAFADEFPAVGSGIAPVQLTMDQDSNLIELGQEFDRISMLAKSQFDDEN